MLNVLVVLRGGLTCDAAAAAATCDENEAAAVAADGEAALKD